MLAYMILALVYMSTIVPTMLLGGRLALFPYSANGGLHALILSSGLNWQFDG